MTAPTTSTPTFEQRRDRVVVDVWSDVMCPFCFLGDTLLADAVERFDHPVEVRYHSFQLMPELPVGPGRPVVEVLSELRGISREQAEAMNAQVAARGAELGLDLRFDEVLAVNTRAAHRLLHLARAHDRQPDAVRRLFLAYFTEGLDLGDHGVLADLGAEVGLDRDEVLVALTEARYDDAVDADVAFARRLGISGVPFFVLDGTYAVSGAQPADVFDRALQAAWEAKGATS